MSDMHDDNVVKLDEKKLRRMLNRIYQLERTSLNITTTQAFLSTVAHLTRP